MQITYWRKACLSRLIRKLIRAVLRRVRESNLPILSDYYSSYLLPEMTREDVIKDALNDFYEEIDEVIDEMDECYNRFINANYVIEEADGWEDEDLSEKVKCPECGKEIVRHIRSDSTCPKCGGRSFLASSICYD